VQPGVVVGERGEFPVEAVLIEHGPPVWLTLDRGIDRTHRAMKPTLGGAWVAEPLLPAGTLGEAVCR
jgi:hypothetical protein